MRMAESSPTNDMETESSACTVSHELLGAATFRHKLRQFNDLLSTLGEPLGISPQEVEAMRDRERDLEARVVRHRQSLQTLAEAQEALDSAKLRVQRLAGEYRVVRRDTAAQMERILADAPPVAGRRVHRAGLRDLLYSGGETETVPLSSPVACPVPQAVRVASAKPGAHCFELSWTVLTPNGACGFEIEAAHGKPADPATYLPTELFEPVGVVPAPCFVHDVCHAISHEPPAHDTPIHYRVRTISESGETSAWSQPVCAVYKAAHEHGTAFAKDAPIRKSGIATPSGGRMAWNPVPA